MRLTPSRTAASGKPTRIVLGRPAEASTSTWTGTASMPTSANVLSLSELQSWPIHCVARCHTQRRLVGRSILTRTQTNCSYSATFIHRHDPLFNPPRCPRSKPNLHPAPALVHSARLHAAREERQI